MKAVILAIVLLLAATAWAQTTSFTITDLGTLDGGVNHPYSVARAVNDHGDVVGESFVRSSILTHAFLLDAGSSAPIDLGVMAADGGRTARAINDSGAIAGAITDEMRVDRAYRWTATGGLAILTTFQSRGFGMNRSGTVVGEFLDGGNARPFLADDSGFLDLGLPPGASAASALAINDVGMVAGTYTDPRDRYSCKAFIWTAEDAFRELFPNSNGCSMAFAINVHGQVAGYQYSANSWRAFVTTPGGKTRAYGAKGTTSTAYGLNDAGVAVGESGGRAALFIDGQVIDLNTRIPAGTGWQLLVAYDINNASEIVGMGVIDGERHAFHIRPVQ